MVLLLTAICHHIRVCNTYLFSMRLSLCFRINGHQNDGAIPVCEFKAKTSHLKSLVSHTYTQINGDSHARFVKFIKTE